MKTKKQTKPAGKTTPAFASRSAIPAAILSGAISCNTHKETTSHTSWKSDISDSTLMHQKWHIATAMESYCTVNADSVSVSLYADSLITSQGTRIYKPSLRKSIARPTVSLTNSDSLTAAHTMSGTHTRNATSSGITQTHTSHERNFPKVQCGIVSAITVTIAACIILLLKIRSRSRKT